MNKNIKLLLGASSVAMLSICALQGCSSDSTGTTTPGAGATGVAGAHAGGATGTAGAPAGGATGTAGGTSTAGAPAGGATGTAGASAGGSSGAGMGGASTAGAGGTGGSAAGAGGSSAGAGGSSAGAGGSAAGAGGGAGAPSADCTLFCSDEMTTCTFGAASDAPYTGAPACLAACASFAAGTVGMTSGDTFGCRRYHLTAAAGGANDTEKAANKKTHCPHTGKPSVAMYMDATATGPCK